MSFKLIIILILQCSVSLFAQAGASYCGPYTVSNPIAYDGVSNITLSELDISNPNGNAIRLKNCDNITIQRCKIGSSLGNGIDLLNCTNITILDCRMDNVATGVYAVNSETIKVSHIEVTNVNGPFPRGQLVQFNNVNGTGNRINYNVVENPVGTSGQEDAINLYISNGTANDPIQVIGNWIRGGGPSNSGGGILLGDNGGSYCVVKDNILVNPGQYGIGVSSGTNIEVANNKVYSAQHPYTNVGIYVWNQYSTNCASIIVKDNEVNWTNMNGVLNGGWNNGNCGNVTGWSTNNWSANIDATILPNNIVIDCSLLPVGMLTFEARQDKNRVFLNWRTAHEINNKGFKVERSKDLKFWKPIGFISGNGSTQKESSYKFEDKVPFVGINYYRLVQEDFDGLHTHSKVLNITILDHQQFSFYPNPTKGIIFFKTKLDGQVHIFNTLGQTVGICEKVSQIDLSYLPPGVYSISYSNTLEKRWGRVVLEK